jgi:hypothetical protein
VGVGVVIEYTADQAEGRGNKHRDHAIQLLRGARPLLLCSDSGAASGFIKASERAQKIGGAGANGYKRARRQCHSAEPGILGGIRIWRNLPSAMGSVKLMVPNRCNREPG